MLTKISYGVLFAIFVCQTFNAMHELSGQRQKQRIAIIGTGYVGLVTGAGLSDIGNTVVCADIVKEKIASLKHGVMPIYEPGLDKLVANNVESGRLSFTDDVATAVRDADIVFIAVGTPMASDGSADLSAIKSVISTVARNLTGHKIICTKSTVPVGTGAWIRKLMEENGAPRDGFDVVSNPEFLREGSAVGDFLHPDRIVIGTESDTAQKAMYEVYRPMIEARVPVVFTNVPTSETIKYAANGFLATKISYINEIANLCAAVGASVYTVARGMGLDRRIGQMFLNPGPGFGGSCFPKDCHALAYTAAKNGVAMRVINAALEANEYQKASAATRLARLMGTLEGKGVAVLGLAFKDNTDDVRESPSLSTIKALLDAKAHVRAHDPLPLASKNMQTIFPTSIVKYAPTAYEAAEKADGCVVMTEWPDYRNLDLPRLGSVMAGRVLVDMRGMIDPRKAREAGFSFDSIGV